MMKALELLKCLETELILPEVFDILPENFKLFLRYFKTGSEEDIYLYSQVLLKDSGKIEAIRWGNTDKSPWIEKGERLLHLSTIDELLAELKAFHSKIEYWHTKKMIQIGHTHSDILLMQIEDKNSGQILIYGNSTPTKGEEFVKVTDNIFSLMFKIELVPDVDILNDYGLSTQDLQRNFEENFWREK